MNEDYFIPLILTCVLFGMFVVIVVWMMIPAKKGLPEYKEPPAIHEKFSELLSQCFRPSKHEYGRDMKMADKERMNEIAEQEAFRKKYPYPWKQEKGKVESLVCGEHPYGRSLVRPPLDMMK